MSEEHRERNRILLTLRVSARPMTRQEVAELVPDLAPGMVHYHLVELAIGPHVDQIGKSGNFTYVATKVLR